MPFQHPLKFIQLPCSHHRTLRYASRHKKVVCYDDDDTVDDSASLNDQTKQLRHLKLYACACLRDLSLHIYTHCTPHNVYTSRPSSWQMTIKTETTLFYWPSILFVLKFKHSFHRSNSRIASCRRAPSTH